MCFQKLLKSKYQDDRIHHNFGIALYKVGKYKDAEKQFIFSKLNKSKYYLLRCQFLRGDQKLFHRTLDGVELMRAILRILFWYQN